MLILDVTTGEIGAAPRIPEKNKERGAKINLGFEPPLLRLPCTWFKNREHSFAATVVYKLVKREKSAVYLFLNKREHISECTSC